MKLIMILQEEKIKASIKDFWDMVELRLKMLQNKSKEIHDLSEWTKIIRIENIFRQCDKTCVFINENWEPSGSQFIICNQPVLHQ